MRKNTAGQKWRVFAFNRTTNAPVTGDAANITAKIAKDFGARAAIVDTNPAEAEDGFYYFDLTAAETNGDTLELYPESSSANVQVIGVPGMFVTSGGGTSSSSGGGDQGDVEERYWERAIDLYTGETQIVDAEAMNDLNGLSLSLSIDSMSGTTQHIVGNASISKNGLKWSATIDPAITASAREWRYALRSGAKVYAAGLLTVRRAPQGTTDPPIITVQPAERSAVLGGSATFSVTATGATSYQWQYSLLGSSWSDIAAATSSSYAISSAAIADQGYYRVRVTNQFGTTDSASATFTLLAQKQVRGFTDANYFQAAAGGLTKLGTARVIAKLLTSSLPTNEIFVGRTDGNGTDGGWYLGTGIGGNPAAIYASQRTDSGAVFSDPFAVVPGDVGSMFVLHATYTGGKLHLYVGGMEIGTGVSGGTALAASGGHLFTIGKFQHAANYFLSAWAIVDIATSGSAMTAQEIFDDAKAIQSRTSNIVIPRLAGEMDRFVADDIFASTNWVSRTGSLTAVRNGSLTVEAF